MSRVLLTAAVGVWLPVGLGGCGGGGGTTLPGLAITSIFPRGSVGAPDARAQFNAVPNQPVNSIAWNFDGGATPNTSTAIEPAVTLGAAGSYTGSVTMTTMGGDTSTSSFNFTVAAVTPPATLTTYALQGTGPELIEPFMVVHQGRLWIALQDEATEELRLAHALSDLPMAATDWEFHTVTDTRPMRFSTTMTVHNNRLIVVTIAETGEVELAQARVAEPSTNADWQVLTLDNAGPAAADVFVVSQNNRLVVGYWGGDPGAPPGPGQDPDESDGQNPTPVVIHQAASSTVDAASDFGRYVLDADANHYPVDLIVHEGNLVASYAAFPSGAPKIALAEVANPSGPADWRFHLIDPAENADGPDAHLAVVGDRLLALYHREGGFLMCARSRVPQPLDSSDWLITPVDTDAVPRARNAIAVRDNRLAFSYINTTTRTYRIARALSAGPTTFADWDIRTPDATFETGRFSALAHSGAAWVACYSDDSNPDNGLLKIAVAPGEW